MENAQLALPFIEDELVRIGYLPPIPAPKKAVTHLHRHIIGWVRDVTVEGTHNMKPVFCSGVACPVCDSENTRITSS
jgi:hypothetical protein